MDSSTLIQRFEAATKLAVHASSYHAKFGTGAPVPIPVYVNGADQLDYALDWFGSTKGGIAMDDANTWYTQIHGGPNDGKRTYEQAVFTWEHVTAEGNYRYPTIKLVVLK